MLQREFFSAQTWRSKSQNERQRFELLVGIACITDRTLSHLINVKNDSLSSVQCKLLEIALFAQLSIRLARDAAQHGDPFHWHCR